MTNENETVAEVCAKLKEIANGQNVNNDGLVIEISQEEIWDALDRIEAAHKREIAELRAKLKVAEEALVKLQDRLVSSVYDGTIDPHKALKIAEDAIAAIREKGGAE